MGSVKLVEAIPRFVSTVPHIYAMGHRVRKANTTIACQNSGRLASYQIPGNERERPLERGLLFSHLICIGFLHMSSIGCCVFEGSTKFLAQGSKVDGVAGQGGEEVRCPV